MSDLLERFREELERAQVERWIVDEAPIVLDYGVSACRLRLTVRDLKELVALAAPAPGETA